MADVSSLVRIMLAVLAIVILFAGTVGIGALLIRWATATRTKSFFSAASPLVGFAAAGLWLNLAGRVLSWNGAVLLWLLFCIGALILALHLWRRLETDGDWSAIKRVWIFIFPAALLLGLCGGLFDEGWHFPFSELIANGHWPARYPFDPSVALTYHFGFDIVIAAFARFGLWAPIASDLWQAVLQASLVGLGYLLAGRWIPRARDRWLVVGLWLFAGSFGWILRPFRAWLPDVFQVLPPFTGSISNSIALITYTKSLFVACGFLLILLFPFVSFKKTWRWHVALVAALAAIALSSESLLVIMIAPVCLGLVWTFRGASARIRLLVALAAGALFATVQGSLLTAFVLSKLPGAEAAQELQAAFALRTSPMFKTFGGWMDLTSVWSWVRIVAEWGGQAVLAVLAFVGWKRWDWTIRAGLIGGALSLAIPFVFVYPATEYDMTRFFWHAFFLLNFVGAIVLVTRLERWPRVRLAVAGVLMLGGVVSTFLSNIPIVRWVASEQPQVASQALWGPLLHRDALLPTGSVVWLSVPWSEDRHVPDEVREIPSVFGVYAKTCYDFSKYLISTDCDQFYAHPTNALMRSMGVTHLLLRPEWIETHREGDWVASVRELKTFTPPVWADRLPATWRQGYAGPLVLYQVITP